MSEQVGAAVPGPRAVHDRGHLPAEGWGIVQTAEGRRRQFAPASERIIEHLPAPTSASEEAPA